MTKEDGNIFNAKVLEFIRRDIYVVHNHKLASDYFMHLRIIYTNCLLHGCQRGYACHPPESRIMTLVLEIRAK
jgi:hypothetical protein